MLITAGHGSNSYASQDFDSIAGNQSNASGPLRISDALRTALRTRPGRETALYRRSFPARATPSLHVLLSDRLPRPNPR